VKRFVVNHQAKRKLMIETSGLLFPERKPITADVKPDAQLLAKVVK
jgi:hypothetical protein